MWHDDIPTRPARHLLELESSRAAAFSHESFRHSAPLLVDLNLPIPNFPTSFLLRYPSCLDLEPELLELIAAPSRYLRQHGRPCSSTLSLP